MDNVLLASVEERKILEKDINAQITHPLSLHIAEEAERRRTANSIVHASNRLRQQQQQSPTAECILGSRMISLLDSGGGTAFQGIGRKTNGAGMEFDDAKWWF